MAGVCNFVTYLFVRYFVKETKGNSITKNIALMLNKSQREVTQFVQRTQQNITTPNETEESKSKKGGDNNVTESNDNDYASVKVDQDTVSDK